MRSSTGLAARDVSDTPPPSRILELLLDADVDFVLVGGVAVVLHALPRFTNDVDIARRVDPIALSRDLADAAAPFRVPGLKTKSGTKS